MEISEILVIAMFGTFMLLLFIGWGASAPNMSDGDASTPTFPGLMEAAALIFVAFTGYGRIATLAEEVRDPRRSIPPAIALTVAITALLYLGVGAVLVRWGMTGAKSLDLLFAGHAPGWLLGLLALAGAVAMAGVLLNLLIGLSRVVLAMGRRGDLPKTAARLDGQEPRVAIAIAAIIIGGLCLLGDLKLAWSFSAVTVLIYYAITNAAALRLPPDERLYPRWIAVAGLGGCAALALFVPPAYWLWTLVLLGATTLWRMALRQRVRSRDAAPD